MTISEFLKDVPDYTEFLTVEELDASTRALHEKYPQDTEVFTIGQTREGRDLLCLKLGDGKKNALMFGCPHPNEPIGTMMLEYFCRHAMENPEFLKELDYTWYIVKAWDADGLARNEKWLKGPFTVTHYAKNYYRPASKEQVDWTFPVEYKKLVFHDSLPETVAMMGLIDKIQPHIIYSLHNSGFGGVYWYVSDDVPGLYEPMRELVSSQQIPLHLGDPESPYLEELAPAVYKAEGIWQTYDYLEANGVENIEEVLGGTASDDYAGQRYGTFTLLTELPYFYSPKIVDLSLSERTKRSIALERLEKQASSNKELRDILARNKEHFSKKNVYVSAVMDFTKSEHVDAEREDVQTNAKYESLAKESEVFDNLLVSDVYTLLSYGMLVRAFEEDQLTDICEEDYTLSKKLFEERAQRLEKELDYHPIPIKKLVTLQLGCGLMMAQEMKDRD